MHSGNLVAATAILSMMPAFLVGALNLTPTMVRRLIARAVLLMLIPFVAPRAVAAQQKPPAVAVDLSSLDRAIYRQIDGIGLERRAVLRLIQEGFAVLAPKPDVDVHLQLMSDAGRLIIEAKSALGTSRREVLLGEEPISELQLETCQKMVELARLSSPPIQQKAETAPPSEPLPIPQVEPVAETSIPQATGPQLERVVELEAGIRAIWRSTPDVMPHMSGALRFWKHVGLLCDAAFLRSSEESLTLMEWQAQAGIGIQRKLTPLVSVEAGVLVGILGHHYRMTLSSENQDIGTRFDVLATLPLEVTFPLVSSIDFGIRAAPGVASRGRTHTLSGKTLWSRSAFRLETGVSLRWSL